VPYFDRFDIVSAYYLFLTFYHDGQASKFYGRLCKLLKHFRPGPSLSDETDLTENGRAIYDRLVEHHLATAH
jgi:hypothetical protein